MSQECRWITFSLNGVRIAACTGKGWTPEEIQETAELLAFENGVDPKHIVIDYE